MNKNLNSSGFLKHFLAFPPKMNRGHFLFQPKICRGGSLQKCNESDSEEKIVDKNAKIHYLTFRVREVAPYLGDLGYTQCSPYVSFS